MRTIMCYSFKGGSGRSTASANIAAALAKLGQKVLVVDMDFEAPGLHFVFDIDVHPDMGIQDFLKGYIDIDRLDKEVVVDAKNKSDDVHFNNLDERSLLLLNASLRSTDIFSSISEEQLNDQMSKLKEYYDDKGFDFMILDAASGIREAFALSIDSSDHVLVFFRYSTQHVEGARRAIKLIKTIYDEDVSVQAIASGVPQLEAESDYSSTAKKIKEERRRIIEVDTSENIAFEIPEIPEFKWKERVITLSNDNTAYEEIARSLIGL